MSGDMIMGGWCSMTSDDIFTWDASYFSKSLRLYYGFPIDNYILSKEG